MANTEHLEILRRGAEIWNLWRLKDPKRLPDLSEADLTSSEFKLRNCDFTFANLSGAILRGQLLSAAGFFGSDLSGADLAKAHLLACNFQKASLVNANLEATT